MAQQLLSLVGIIKFLAALGAIDDDRVIADVRPVDLDHQEVRSEAHYSASWPRAPQNRREATNFEAPSPVLAGRFPLRQNTCRLHRIR
jgi:hypothetical protein